MANWANAEVLETVKKMWLDGASAGYISWRLGGKDSGYTRNSIVGKMHRLGLKQGSRNPSSNLYTKPVNTKKKQRTPKEDLLTKLREEQKAYRESAQEMKNVTVVVPMEERRNVLTATQKQCRYPFGNPTSPDFHFCHLDRDGESRYCKVHRHHVYVNPSPSGKS